MPVGARRVLVSGRSGSGFSLTAPVATWISDAATAQAVFEIDVDSVVVSGDKIWGESSTDNFATVLETVSAAIALADIGPPGGDGQIDDFAFAPFTPDGTYYVRFWVSNSADTQISPKSDVISLAIETAAPPLNTVAPVLTPGAITLTVSDGIWTGDATITFAYQWKRGVTNVGTNSNTYQPVAADAGQSMTCVVTGTNGAGNSTGISNASVMATNLFTKTAQFDDDNWIKTNINVTANTTVAPDSATTAETVTTTGTQHNIRQSVDVTVLASTQYTFSWYALRGTMTDLHYAVFNMTTGSSFVVNDTSYYASTNSSTWSRISVTFTTPVGCTTIRPWLVRDSGATGTVFFWGAQLETGASAKTYIPVA